MDVDYSTTAVVCSQGSENVTKEREETPLTTKRKGRFNIGLYAKRRKLIMNELMEEKLAADTKLKSMQNKVDYRKRKADDLETLVPTPKQRPRMPNTESVICKENSDHVNLSKAQSQRRRKATLRALKPVHCTPRSTDQTPIMNGMWATLINENPPQFIESLVANSKVCKTKVIPSILKNNVTTYEKSQENFVRSTGLLYKGGLLTKNKYKETRKEKVDFMPGVSIPRYVTYDRLMSFIKGINMGDVYDLQDFAAKKGKSPVHGVYRSLESLLLRLADMYLMLNDHSKFLHWFNDQKGKFLVAIGADAAPFGKDETATAYLVSILNVLEGVQSCDHNYLLMGGNCDETHELMYEYTKHVVEEIKEIEAKEYDVHGIKISFQCRLVPSDQKWMASMCGELNNAATYFSTFANVSKADIKTIDGKIGGDDCTWKTWAYDKRLKDADYVKLFKTKNKIPDGSKASNHRKKVTEYIASRKSRQEFHPPLDKYVSRVHINESDMNVLKNECEMYYNCQALLLANVKPTTWTIGKAIPFYTDKIYHDLGFGLGLNSMQGREAKHIKLSCYAKNTTKGKQLRWWQVFKHEFMELVWLKENDAKKVAKKLHSTSHSENEEKSFKDRYIPPYCINNDTFCTCGQPKSVTVTSCPICCSDIFELVVKSCKAGKIDGKLKVNI
ncbi:uncharacterized protein LOC110248623 [Exaiptasia diaphana]|uniref:Uncharacterized protein n=1 Tax=Exaiptasia diaphana TaxID=2652724 RepID=A0A913XWA4_EXADI|nr:uncharacterized protein LOC110248623 [Exaiptasia diaphana]